MTERQFDGGRMRWWSLVILVVSGCSGVPGIDGGVVDGGVDTGVDGGGDAGVAVPDKTSGHRTRFHWLSSGEVVHQALASEVAVFVENDGGFEELAVTRLDDARFEFSARGEVIVRAGDSWLVSDSRQLDLDEVGELGQPDAGPPMPMVVVPITRADGGGLTGRLDYFSPDTRSFLEEHLDGSVAFAFSRYPEAASGVRTWFFEANRRNSSNADAGSTFFELTHGGAAVVEGVPRDGGIVLEFVTGEEATWSTAVVLQPFLDLLTTIHPQRRYLLSSNELLVAPRIEVRPGSVGRGLNSWVPLAVHMETTRGLPSSLDVALTTQVPFTGWNRSYSWGLSVAAGPSNRRAGLAGFSVSSRSPLTTVALTLSPPRALTIDGADAFTTGAFASETPRVAWLAPTTGVPDWYRVDFLPEGDGSSPRTLLTQKTAVRLPPGFAVGRGSLRVSAVRVPGGLAAGAHPPLDLPIEHTSAETISALWDPLQG